MKEFAVEEESRNVRTKPRDASPQSRSGGSGIRGMLRLPAKATVSRSHSP